MTYNEYIEKCIQYIPEMIAEHNEWHKMSYTYEISGINKGNYSYTLLTIYNKDVNKSINLVIPYLITLEYGELDSWGIKRILREMIERFFSIEIFWKMENFPNFYPYIEELEEELKLSVEQDKDHKENISPTRIANNSPVDRQLISELRIRAASPRRDAEYYRVSQYLRTVLEEDKIGRITISGKRDVKKFEDQIAYYERKLKEVNITLKTRGLCEKEKNRYEKLKRKFGGKLENAEVELIRRKNNIHVNSLKYNINKVKVAAVNNLVFTVFFIKYVVRKGR